MMYSTERRRWWAKSYCLSNAKISESGHAFFGGHERSTLFAIGSVNADSYVNACFVEECFELREFADARDGDSFRAPSEAPIGSEYFDSLKHLVEVVKRLAHAHEY